MAISLCAFYATTTAKAGAASLEEAHFGSPAYTLAWSQVTLTHPSLVTANVVLNKQDMHHVARGGV